MGLAPVQLLMLLRARMVACPLEPRARRESPLRTLTHCRIALLDQAGAQRPHVEAPILAAQLTQTLSPIIGTTTMTTTPRSLEIAETPLNRTVVGEI